MFFRWSATFSDWNNICRLEGWFTPLTTCCSPSSGEAKLAGIFWSVSMLCFYYRWIEGQLLNGFSSAFCQGLSNSESSQIDCQQLSRFKPVALRRPLIPNPACALSDETNMLAYLHLALFIGQEPPAVLPIHISMVLPWKSLEILTKKCGAQWRKLHCKQPNMWKMD